jgi:tRNA threonylcarbamoyladenosine biosynthesis protein TsaB
MPEVERSVELAGGWERIERIAVGLGPGSYTGLRIGIATARALSQARGISLIGVGTLAALAAGIRERAAGDPRPALPVLDARRGQAFVALYERRGVEAWPALVLAPESLAARVRRLDEQPVAAGSGSLRFAAELESAGAAVAPPGDPVHRVAARHICALGDRAEASPASQIEPIYLRPPDADKWLERDTADRDD